jgi:hypothetical protein
MRRTVLAWVMIWTTGTALAADPPADVAKPTLPAVQPLQTVIPLVPSTDAGPTSPPDVAAPPVVTSPQPPPVADSFRVFGSADYVVGWMRHNPAPPLVQTLPADLANFQANGGKLPPGQTTTIFGSRGIDQGTFDGFRADAGMYLDRCGQWGIDASYLEYAQKSESFSIVSLGAPVIGRYYFDPAGAQNVFLRYTSPDGLSTGYIAANAPAQFYTYDANIRAEGPSVLSDRVDYLLGYRYLNLKDSISIDSAASVRADANSPPFNITSHESFFARNEFWGAQTGFDTYYRWGCFTVQFTGKIAFGEVRERVLIDGVLTTQAGNNPVQVFPNESILLVQPSNAGFHQRTRFAVLPEGLIKLGYQITPHIRFDFGYDALVVSNVQRSGTSIDQNVNPQLTRLLAAQTPSTIGRPFFDYNSSDVWWAQALTIGLAVAY